jgi:hypothetical protein
VEAIHVTEESPARHAAIEHLFASLLTTIAQPSFHQQLKEQLIGDKVNDCPTAATPKAEGPGGFIADAVEVISSAIMRTSETAKSRFDPHGKAVCRLCQCIVGTGGEAHITSLIVSMVLNKTGSTIHPRTLQLLVDKLVGNGIAYAKAMKLIGEIKGDVARVLIGAHRLRERTYG